MTITVSGVSKEGKSALIFLISQALADIGLETALGANEIMDGPYLPGAVEAERAHVARRVLQGRTFVIDSQLLNK